MIYCLTGKIIKKTLNAVVLSCGGVGYFAQCPASVAGALPGVGKDATIYTVMSVTENDVSLYGFATEEQQACFEMLTAVSERHGARPCGAGHLGGRPQGVQGRVRRRPQAGPAHRAGTEGQGSQGLRGGHQPGRCGRCCGRHARRSGGRAGHCGAGVAGLQPEPFPRSTRPCPWKRSSSWPCGAWQAGGNPCRTKPRSMAQK